MPFKTVNFLNICQKNGNNIKHRLLNPKRAVKQSLLKVMYIFIIIPLYYAWQIAGSRKGAADKKEFGSVPNSFLLIKVRF